MQKLLLIRAVLGLEDPRITQLYSRMAHYFYFFGCDYETLLALRRWASTWPACGRGSDVARMRAWVRRGMPAATLSHVPVLLFVLIGATPTVPDGDEGEAAALSESELDGLHAGDLEGALKAWERAAVHHFIARGQDRSLVKNAMERRALLAASHLLEGWVVHISRWALEAAATNRTQRGLARGLLRVSRDLNLPSRPLS